VLDGSIANVALPTIAADLNAPAANSVWVVNAYQLAIAPGETSNGRRRAVAAPVFESDKRLSATAQSP
jgi:MFS family permease